MKTRLLFIAATFLLFFNGSIKAQVYTNQSRTFTFTELAHSAATTYNGNAQHDLAVWIEQGTGTAGTFIVTKFRYVGSGTKDHLPTWAVKAGGAATNATTACNILTATTGATLSAWQTNKAVIWDGKNAAGTLVADGNYQFVVQSTWDHGAAGTVTRYFPFVKGPGAANPTFTADANFTAITATLANPEFSIKPEVTIYPNPTNGIFNIDFKNDVNSIRVVDILGKVVYSEKIASASADTTKRIDLSNLNNGLYIVSVTNDNGTSNYKVILNK